MRYKTIFESFQDYPVELNIIYTIPPRSVLSRPNNFHKKRQFLRISIESFNALDCGKYLVPTTTLFDNNSLLPCICLIEKKSFSYEWKETYILTENGPINTKDKIALIELGYVPRIFEPISSYSPIFSNSIDSANDKPQLIINGKYLKSNCPYKIQVGSGIINPNKPPFPFDLNRKIFFYHSKDKSDSVNGNFSKIFPSHEPLNTKSQKDIDRGWISARICL